MNRHANRRESSSMTNLNLVSASRRWSPGPRTELDSGPRKVSPAGKVSRLDFDEA